MKLALLAAALLLLPGCHPRAFPYALRPASEGPRCFSTQEVVFRRPGAQAERFITTVENDGSRLSVVVSTPMGQTLFVLRTTDGPLEVDARVPLPPALDPSLLPAMIQLSDWPLAEARKGLPRGMELREEGPRRTLLKGGKPMLEMTREGGAPPYRHITLRIPALGLEAEITTLDD